MKEEKEEFTRFERARMIGTRALQISAGAPPLIKTEKVNPIEIAEEEFEAGQSPLRVKPKLPSVAEK